MSSSTIYMQPYTQINNINNTSVHWILLYKPIDTREYKNWQLNMYLLSHVDAHRVQEAAFVSTCRLPACMSCFILGKEWHFSSFTPHPFCLGWSQLLYFPQQAHLVEHIVVKANGLVSPKGAICKNYSSKHSRPSPKKNIHRMWRNNSTDVRSKMSPQLGVN